MLHKDVEKHLIEIFKAVADACDSSFDEGDAGLIREVYGEAMKHPKVREFYSKLVDERHKQVFGGR